MMAKSYRQYQADLLQEVGKRKDLWMIKTIYLVYLLRQHGVDVQWILQFEDKQELYNKLEALWKEVE
jgi:hypothetical protein